MWCRRLRQVVPVDRRAPLSVERAEAHLFRWVQATAQRHTSSDHSKTDSHGQSNIHIHSQRRGWSVRAVRTNHPRFEPAPATGSTPDELVRPVKFGHRDADALASSDGVSVCQPARVGCGRRRLDFAASALSGDESAVGAGRR